MIAVVPGEEELGRQRYCPQCHSWWPDDSTFFQVNAKAGTTYIVRGREYLRRRDAASTHCRACRAEAATLRQRYRRFNDDQERRDALRENWRLSKQRSRARAKAAA